MNGAQQAFFCGVACGQFLAGVGGGPGGEEPNRPWRPKSAHEADAVPRKKRPAAAAASSSRNRKKDHPAAAAPADQQEEAAAAGAYACPICHRLFDALKAVHGHQRSHPERDWRGMAPPRPLPPVAADGKQYRYACERCGVPFETRQALGGHRASHSGKKGCYSLSRQQQQEQDPPAAAAAAPMPVVFPFDLNEPAPEQEE